MGMVAFRRHELQKILVEALDDSVVKVHYRKKLVSYNQPSPSDYSQPGPVILHFGDDTTATCDALISADGIHSATRAKMYRDMAEEVRAQDPSRAEELLGLIDPVWSGSVIYRRVIPGEQLRAIAPEHRGLARSMIVSFLIYGNYPILILRVVSGKG